MADSKDKEHSLRIVFMGTPEFAVASLRILVENNHSIVGVITAPDKPKGRGQKLIPSPVKEYALEQNLNILQPTNLKDPEFIKTLSELKPDLQIVVAFRMLPEVVWNLPPKGTFNLHASLLPNYRGAAPINWAIINGEKETGITTFFLQHEIDTGDIILQEKEPIDEKDNAESLYLRLMNKGAGLVLKTVELIEQDKVNPQPQMEVHEIKDAPKIFKETCEIRWDTSAKKVYDFIRGLSPFPGAWTTLNQKKYKILSGKITAQKAGKPGEIMTDQKKYLRIGCLDYALEITELQAEGKRKMKTEDYFRGNEL